VRWLFYREETIRAPGAVIFPNSAQTLQQWDNQFSDEHRWNLAQYGTTMMFADLNGDGKMDVCGRGALGVYCELSNGTGFGPIFLALTSSRMLRAGTRFPTMARFDWPTSTVTVGLKFAAGER
jgi:hypothetical protein